MIWWPKINQREFWTTVKPYSSLYLPINRSTNIHLSNLNSNIWKLRYWLLMTSYLRLLFSWSVRLERWSGKHDAVCMTSSILYCGSQGRSVTGTYLTAVWTCRTLIYPKICCEQASDHSDDLHPGPRVLMEAHKTPLLLQFEGPHIFRFSLRSFLL